MKRLLLLASFLLSSVFLFANHITGGEMYYVFKSKSGTNYTYQVTLKLFRDCNAPPNSAQLDDSVAIGIFEKGSSRNINTLIIRRSTIDVQDLRAPGPCIFNAPKVCYQVGYYVFDVTLPSSPTGYVLAYQRCCRITGINNLVPNSNQHGATYTAQIPGTESLAAAPENNSAKFVGIDTVIVCANNNFCYNFGATDADGDELRYSFCNAFTGGSSNTPAPNPPSPPQADGNYFAVPYRFPFRADQPMGAGVTLNSQSGLMCGIAPAPGIYVVTVCVDEYRNGIKIATQRKDLQIKVGDCNVAQAVPVVFDSTGALIRPEAAGCRSLSYRFANSVPPNPLIHTYYWEVSDGAVYTTANPSHTFADTGVYSVKLTVNRGEQCVSSAVTTIRVYPGFRPNFDIAGICVNKVISFTDKTTADYGFVDSWRWNFGVGAGFDDTARQRTTANIYTQPGTYNAELIVTTSKGCIDTVRKPIDVLTRPPISLAFADTLICNGDRLQLHATGNGIFSWTPNYNIIDANTSDPTVFPAVTTDYSVKLDFDGCIGFDTVKVRVVDFVTLKAMPDTTICATDTLRLSAASDGLRFFWTPAATILDDATLINPLARPLQTTNYTVRAVIGGCATTDDVTVKLVPYPVANAGADTVICYNTFAQLSGSHDGSSFFWTPANTLSNPVSLTPIARPVGTLEYVLSSFDTKGCPKLGRDTVLVTVNPEVIPFAGRDTAIVINQPLQFTATGGESYEWLPATSLNNSLIANPIGRYGGEFDSIRYFVNVRDNIGCLATASVGVRVFKTAPRVFVPSAFTPNKDGKNDLLRPIAVGLTRLEYFRIYNRWGQLVFETTRSGQGWDGRIKGQEQGTQTYVWIVKGQDFTGKTVFDKGNITLIR